MSAESTKEHISVTLDEEVVESIDNMDGVKRSTLINSVMADWLEENGHIVEA